MAASIDTAGVWNAYHARLHAFIVSRVNDRDAADDILQDVFLKTHARLGDLTHEAKLQSWLYQIARNAIIDYYRKHRAEGVAADELADESPESSRNAVHQLAECLRPMIATLPEQYRDALVLADLEGLTQSQIAERENISLSGAKSRVQRARGMLRDLLDECCRFEFDQRGHLVSYAPHACDDDCEPS